jgi:hypothetical protein
MPATIRLTASIKDVNAALSWVREVRPDKITLALDAQRGTAEFRCLSKVGSFAPGYREYPIVCQSVRGSRSKGSPSKVSVYLASPNHLKDALKLAKYAEDTCTITVSYDANNTPKSVKLHAGKHTVLPLAFDGVSRSPRPKMATLGSVASKNLVNALKSARSIVKRDDPNKLYTLFKLNQAKQQLEIFANSSAAPMATALFYSTPFNENADDGDFNTQMLSTLSDGIAISPEPHNFNGESTEIIASGEMLGFKDSETGAIALYSKRAIVEGNVATIRAFFENVERATFTSSVEVDLGSLKEAIVTSAAANPNHPTAHVALRNDGTVLVKVGDWVTELVAVDGGVNVVPLVANVNYRSFIDFVTPRIQRNTTVSFLPESGKGNVSRGTACHVSDDGDGRLLVVTICDNVETKNEKA